MKKRIRVVLSILLCLVLVSSALPLAYGTPWATGTQAAGQEVALPNTAFYEPEVIEGVIPEQEPADNQASDNADVDDQQLAEDAEVASDEALVEEVPSEPALITTLSGSVTQPEGTYAFQKEFPVQTGNDDAYVSTSAVNLVATSLYLNGKIGSVPYTNYLRFTGVELPADAVISEAYLSFSTYTASTQPTHISISGELSEGTAFGSTVASYTLRQFTESTPAMTTPVLGAAATYNTEDLTAVLNQMRTANSSLSNYVFKIEGDETGSLRVRSYDYNPAYAPKLVVSYYSATGTYTASITDTWDDAEEYGTGKTIASGDGMEIGGYFSTTLTAPYKEITGFRFPGVSLPSTANITNAYLEFTTLATNTQGRVSNMVIRSEIGDAARYASNAGNISARSYGDLSIRYEQPAFTAALQTVRTPNLKDIIDENRLSGWQSGQALAFMIDGDNYIGSVYQGGTAYAPRLVIEYEYTPFDIADRLASDYDSLSQLYINEVAPYGTSADASPWVEIYNANDYTVVLGTNVSLGNATSFNQQNLGSLMIPAHGFRVIQAPAVSFDVREITLAAYMNNSYQVLDAFDMRPVQVGQTWGRFVDAGWTYVSYDEGTYGASNNTLGPAINYSISHATGRYEEGFHLVIETDPCNIVMYTLDGSTPSARNGMVYTSALFIPNESVSNLKVYVYNTRSSVGPYSYRYIVGGASGLDMREQTKTFAIQSGLDDGYANGATANLTDAALYLHGAVGSTVYSNYLRFANVALPEDAIVTNAYLEFTTYSASGAQTNITVAGELGAGAAFSTVANTFTNRSFTSPSAAMSIPNTAAGQTFVTGDISDIVNEMRYTTDGLTNYVFKIEGDNNGILRARSYNHSVASAPRLCVEYLSGYGDSTATITNTQDDAEEYGTAKAIIMNDAMQIGGYTVATLIPAYKEVSAFRFTGIEIPADAEVTNAYMEFTTLGTAAAGRVSHQSVRVEIGNAAGYTTTAGSISARSYGDLAVTYDQSSISTARQTIRTPNLRDLIDENRLRGWQSGDGLAFLLDGDNFIGSVYQGGTAYAPKLVVEYRFSGRGAYIEGAVTDPNLIDQVYINEISSEGTSSSKPDWIELYNANDVPVVLGSDIILWRDKNRKEAHYFKDFMIPAHGYRILYCDKSPEDGNDHADFELKGSAQLQLVSIAGGGERMLHTLTYPSHLYNDTYGLSVDGGTEVIPFARETFCASNNNRQELYALNVSHDRGVYETGFLLYLSSSPNTTLRYTLDGTSPSSSHGLNYTGPININTSCMVKVYAYDARGNTRIQTYTYVLLDNYQNEYYRFISGVQNGYVWQHKTTISSEQYAAGMADLPIVSISSTDAARLKPYADYVQGTFEFLDTHLGGSNYIAEVGLKQFGQASITQYNGNTGIRFKRDYNSTKAKYTFFTNGDNPGKFARLDLKEGQDGPQADVFNLGFLRYDESVTNTLAAQMGKVALDTEYVHSFYNGQYMGVKTLREHFNDNFAEDVFGGDSDDYTKVRYQDGSFAGGIVEAGDGLSALNTKVVGLASAKNFQEFKNYVDVEDMIKTQILYMFIDSEREIDALISNDIASGEGLKMTFNINDNDGAFYNNGGTGTSYSTFAGGGGTYRYKWNFDTTSRWGAGRMFGNFSGDSTSATAGNLEFKTMVKDQVLAMIGPASGDMRGAPGAPLSVDNVRSVLLDNQTKLDNAYRLDAAFMGASNSMYTRWLTENSKVLGQVEDRVSFNLQMWKRYNMAHTLDAVTVNQTASGITLTNPNAGTTVYYTLDGSDPMGANGVVSASAHVYNAGTVLPADADLTVRAFTTNNWGPLSYR